MLRFDNIFSSDQSVAWLLAMSYMELKKDQFEKV